MPAPKTRNKGKRTGTRHDPAPPIESVDDASLVVCAPLKEHQKESRRRGLVTTLTEREWALLVEAYGGCCAYCTRICRMPQVEHVIPRSAGGALSVENIVPACWWCNASKRDTDADTWMRRKGLNVDAVRARMSVARSYVMAGAAVDEACSG